MGTEIGDQKSAILGAMAKFLALAGIVAYIPSVAAGIFEGLWAIVAVDTIAYALTIAVAFHPASSFSLKLVVMIVLALIIGMVVLVQTGPFGAGYLWLLAASILSALFGRGWAIALVNGFSGIFMVAWCAGIALGLVDSMGASPLSVLIIGSNLILISVGLSIVIRSLLVKLAAAIDEHRSVSDRLLVELKDSKYMASELDRTLEAKDDLLRELHHRVRNNLQVVLSIMSMARLDDPGACDTSRRRVRALALANEMTLSRRDAVAVDAGDLFRALASRLVENKYPDPPSVSVDVRSSGDLDPQSAGVTAIVGSELLAAMLGVSAGISIMVRRNGDVVLAEFRFPITIDAESAGRIISGLLDDPLVRAVETEISLTILSREGDLGQGIAM
ncbi:MAG: sensor histidine kinase, partial [Spirochaetales bacterium]